MAKKQLDKAAMLEIREKLQAEGTLFSARHNRDYETMAVWLKDNGFPKLTALEVHTCMVAE